MRRTLLAATLLATFSAPAQDLGQSAMTGMIYWQRPIGAIDKRDEASAFGFRIDRTFPTTGSVVLRKPIADFRFSATGLDSVSLRSLVLYQNQAGAGEPASSINWWIVGGLAAGTTFVVARESRRDADSERRSKRGGS